MNIAEHVARIARARPQHPALFFEGCPLSYETLDRCSSALADAMAKTGVSAGDRIALYLPNIPAFVLAYLASLKLGAIAVSVNSRLKAEEVAYILRDSSPRIVFTTAGLAPNVSPLQCPSVQHLICCEGGSAIADPLESWLDRGSEQRPIRAMGPDEPAVILYSSGTTGFPKGVTLSHFNVISNARTAARSWACQPDDRLAGLLPLFHAFGQNSIMNACFEAGATLLLFRRSSTDALLRALRRARATLFFAVPGVYLALLDANIQRTELGPIRSFFSTGATLPGRASRGWPERFGQAIQEGYGLTECASLAACSDANHPRPGSVGRAVEGFEIRIFGEGGQEVPRGAWGEICIRGPGVMIGYWRKPEDTEQALRGGWLHSGDIGTMDDEGCLSIVDRVKDMIRIAGLKVWPAEVEQVLDRHPAVRELAVHGQPHPDKGESVRATVVLRAGSHANAEELIAFCRERLAGVKVPERIDFVAHLPRSTTGRIIKRLLRARA